MIEIPAALDRCVEGLVKKGKSKSSAFAICTAALKKSGKMDEERIEELSSINYNVNPNNDKDKSMKKKSKETQPGSSHRFSFPISEEILSSFELSEKDKPTNVQILKKGKFRHPWWGILNFDDTFFNNLIGNFDRNVPQEEISFDFQHRPDWGAAAWVEKIFTEDNALMASVVLTERGRESVKKKEFRYFSTEYTDNYVDYQFEEEVGEDGKPVEKEVKVSYGPAILGGGLTNRPFIKGMLPVSLSEAGDEVVLEEIFEEEEVDEEMKKKLEDLEKEQKKLTEDIKKLQEAKDGESKEDEIKELNKKLEDVETELKTLKEANDKEKKKDEDKKLEEERENARKLAEENENMSKELAESRKSIKELTDTVDKLGESVKTLMKTKEVLEDDKAKAEVKAKLADIKQLGVFPGTMKVITKLLSAKEAKGFSVTLSEVKEEGKDPVERTISFADAIHEIMESIPTDRRFSEEENSESIVEAGGSKKLSVEEVEKYAEEHSLTYAEAYIKLDPQGEKA